MLNNQVDILLCGVASPLMAGLYRDLKLTHSLRFEGKAGDGLLELWQEVLGIIQENDSEISRLILVRGPGSFTAIKLSYIFAQSIAITKGIPIVGIDSFALNDNHPIFAFGQSYFVKEEGEIVLRQNMRAVEFVLPENLDGFVFDADCTPLYVLPAL